MLTVKNIVLSLGVVFVLVGVLGFVPGITTMDGDHGHLLGIFEVDAMHNIVHLVSGIVAVALALMGRARLFAQVFGVVYGLVAVLGFAAEGLVDSIMAVNMADHLLHIALAAVFLWAGFLKKEAVPMAVPSMSSGPSQM